ncbi:hypothetical protein Spb1_38390 [Planctopirus ephydatiae]|uniref:Sulfotransferase domain protein n=1 Tax=Planctopirus ephydatiae TaxID=2528019 RepID=A0A518GTI6_9PLAN|nr:sulfotransferase [Planctopirus ephydatiae]QDV31893.1 hypothetical protein Spb1_38390 [Planctopirus ephydatiae]
MSTSSTQIQPKLQQQRLPLALRAFLGTLEFIDSKSGMLSRAIGPLDVESVLLRAAKLARGPVELNTTDEALLRRWLNEFAKAIPLSVIGKAAMKHRAARTVALRSLLDNRISSRPEIIAKPVHRPVFIVSMPRTGTTFLHKLLSQDHRARPLYAWEALSPVVSEKSLQRKEDPRIRQARYISWMQRILVPGFSRMHKFDPLGPEEDTPLLKSTFVSPTDLVFPSGYREWYMQQSPADLSRHLEFYERLLQLLQSERPVPDDGFWALKSPVHGYHLLSLRERFPNAKFIVLHRRMSEVIPSFCSIMSYFFEAILSDKELIRAVPSLLVDWCDCGLRRISESNELIKSSIINIHYRQLVSDPLSTMRKVYSEADISFNEETERGIADYIDRNPKNKHGSHRYSAEEFGLSESQLDSRFEWYHRLYDVPLH